jgi:RNA polymerase sigma-70 factor (ECF subfamily)
MEGAERIAAERGVVTYCLVPRALAPRVHELLRRHFAADPSVVVVVERRGTDRRVEAERRIADGDPAGDRRRILGAGGRRAGERRAALAPVSAPEGLPRRVRAHADQLVWAERLEPPTQHLTDLDTARVVTRFQSGDPLAFETLYLRYFDAVYSYLRVLFREDHHEAEDLAQQAFTRVFEALPRYERRAQPFRSWLFTIVRNLALTQLAKRGRIDPLEPAEAARRRDEAAHDPSDALEWITDRELMMFVERLPLSQRQVLLLRYMLDLSPREAGRILNVSAGHARKLESRALRFLQVRLEALGRTPARPRDRLDSNHRMRWLPVTRQRRYALTR